MKTVSNNIGSFSIPKRLATLLVFLSLMTACTSPTAEPPTISDPVISDPTPQEPGKEVGISIDVSSAGGATLTYTWNADGGEIVRGQGSPAITYRVPEEPGTYNVRVKVEWDGQSTEKVTTIQVEELSTDSPVTDTPMPESPTSTPASEPINTPESTPGPSETSSTAFRDDFDGNLANGWSIVNEVSTHWSLTDVPGSWRVTLQPGGITDSSSPARNLLLRQAPKSDFEIATLVNFTPTSNYQFAGLLIYQDNADTIQLGRAYCDAVDGCVGNGIYFDNIESGEHTGENYATSTSSTSIAYLRLRREGKIYTGYYSEDGTNWTTIGQHNADLNPIQVGLIAAQAYEAETTADFEYFTLTTDL